MNVWFAIPSKRPIEEAAPVLNQWRERGYRIALWRDVGDGPVGCDLSLCGSYPGYALAVNALCAAVFGLDHDAQWIVTGGDDIAPDPERPAEQIGLECSEHFGGTFGVMQPTGDRWGDHGHVYAEHVCGSPWLGRDFCRRMYGSTGPLYSGYYHFYEDEELQEVALKLGILWQRPELTHYHHHRVRERKPRPPWMNNEARLFAEGQQIFLARKLAGFPDHAPIP